MNKDEQIAQALQWTEKNGLTGVSPKELSHGGNLILHLAPYPVVARIAVSATQENSDRAYSSLERELRVALHLQTKKVPVLLPAEPRAAKPHDIGGTWMTLWQYAQPAPLKPLSPSEAVDRVSQLSAAMQEFPDELPALGVWERTCQSAARLKKNADPRVQALLRRFTEVDHRMRLHPDRLIPCHGDAHARNLLPSSSPEGWIWADFEDVSLMPRYWDLASYVGNLALFGGTEEPILAHILNRFDSAADREAFGFALVARTLMSTLGNLDFALAGYGDLDFANRQLEFAEGFIERIDGITGG